MHLESSNKIYHSSSKHLLIIRWWKTELKTEMSSKDNAGSKEFDKEDAKIKMAQALAAWNSHGRWLLQPSGRRHALDRNNL